MWTVEFLVMGAMIAFNSVLAAYEIALAAIAEPRLTALAAEHRRCATSAGRMQPALESSLAVVQLGIALAAAIAAATGGAGASDTIVPLLKPLGLSRTLTEFLAIVLVVVPLTYITIVFGELVPKVFALRNKEWICLTLSPLFEWFGLAAWPAVWLLESSVRVVMLLVPRREPENGDGEQGALQELRASAALARVSRLIGHREEGIIVNAAELPQREIREVMIPAEFISLIWVDDSLANALVAAHLDMHTRFPVTETAEDPQKILGYVNFKDIVAAVRLSPHAAGLRSIMRPIPSFPPETSVAECLDKLIHGHAHIALVRNEERVVLGMITLEDVLEELVGDIRDEYDQLPKHIVPTGGGWILGGDARLERIEEISGLKLPPLEEGESPAETLNQWMLGRLGRPIERGEWMEIGEWRILVRKVRRQYVQEALLLKPE